jgi:flap endonuclease-1
MIRRLSKGKAEICVLSEALENLGLDLGHFIDMALLMGTDYNPGGVRGLGPKRSLQLIRDCGTVKAVLAKTGQNGQAERKLSEIKSYYLDPPVAADWRSSWEPPDNAEAHAYLVQEMKLSEASVGRLLRVMTHPILPGHRQTKLGC